MLAGSSRTQLPDREPLPPRLASLTLAPVEIGGEGVRVTGAWTLTSDDPRVEGLSALALLRGGRLQAVTDSGVLVTFAKPGRAGKAFVSELPAGPGYPTFKKYRDAEAMIVGADGRERLVAFEFRHSLWRFGADGSARSMRLPSAGWRRNKGIEAMVADGGGGILLIPEHGRYLLRLAGSRLGKPLVLRGATGEVADAVALPDGRIAVAVRELGLTGITNRLAWLERDGAGYRLRNFAALDLGPFDNVEGLAAEPDPAGGTILWAVTDSDGWRRTLLIRLKLDAQRAPTAAGAP